MLHAPALEHYSAHDIIQLEYTTCMCIQVWKRIIYAHNNYDHTAKLG